MPKNSDENDATVNWASLREVAAERKINASLQLMFADVVVRSDRNGKEFYDLILHDGAESAKVRLWSNNPLVEQLENIKNNPHILYQSSGFWKYNAEYNSFECDNLELRALDEAARDAFFARLENENSGGNSVADAILEIGDFIKTIQDPIFQKLSSNFFEKYQSRLRRTAAAFKNHHAYRGGLAVHTADMMRSASAIAGAYPQLNRDLLLTGVLFHDCGKLWENCFEEFGFTTKSSLPAELLGHISLGIEFVNQLWHDIFDKNQESENDGEISAEEKKRLTACRFHLLHLIASHHGELEYGSPIMPKIPEAIALHYIDNLDAKLEMFRMGYKNATPTPSGAYPRIFPLNIAPHEPLAHFSE